MSQLTSFVAGLYVLTVLGRLPELVPALIPLQLGKVSIALGLLLMFATKTDRIRTVLAELPISRPLLVLLLVGVCTAPFSVWRGGAVDTVMSYAKTLCGFVMLITLLENREQTLRFFIALSTGLLAALMLLNKSAGRMQVSSSYDPNDIALLFVVFLPMLTVEGLIGKGLMRLLCWGAAFAALGGIALTQSRGGLVALAAVGLHAVLLAKRQRLLILILCAVGAAILLHTADASFWERFSAVTDESDYNLTSKSGRLEIWKGGMEVLLDRPIGVGIGQFGPAMGMIGSGVYLTAHNSYIQTLVELSLPGFIAYMLLLWRARRMALACAAEDKDRAARTRGLGLSLSLTGFAAGSFFLSQAYGIILYMLLTLISVTWLACRLDTTVESENSEQPEPEEVHEAPVSLSAKAEAVRRARQERLYRGDSLNKHRGQA